MISISEPTVSSHGGSVGIASNERERSDRPDAGMVPGS